MKKWLSIIAAAGLLLYPFAAFSEDYGSQPSQTQQAPPVAQSLVREGDFAIKLAATLDLGTPTEEAVAEDMLVKAGVAPLNGWISDYPITPQILDQLHNSIVKAADEKKLPMNSDEGTRGLNYLAKQMNLATPAGPANASSAPNPPEEASSPTVINNYYNDAGPPVITYYSPPYDYAYLYDWVPYPVFWFGFWFPGFFICHDFTTTVFVNGPFFFHRPFIVSNHVIDPATRTAFRIDPVARTVSGTVRPVTMLRAPSGRTFTNLTEMRSVVKVSGLTAVRPVGSVSGTRTANGFRTTEARKSALSIYSRNAAGTRYDRGQVRSTYSGAGRSYGSQPFRGNGETIRHYDSQGAPGRSYNRYNGNGSSGGYERRSVPNHSTGQYGGSMIRGGQQSIRSWSGNGVRAGGGYSGRASVRPSRQL